MIGQNNFKKHNLPPKKKWVAEFEDSNEADEDLVNLLVPSLNDSI